jgi:flagellar basal-body rod protein FlgB
VKGTDMSTDNLALFRVIDEKMNWLSQRQRVIAQNISHADTPGYRSQDIAEFDFESALRGASNLARTSGSEGRSSVARTSDQHLVSMTTGGTAARESDRKKVYESAPSGNSVVLEEQMLLAGQTAGEYQAMTNLYQKYFDILMIAVGRGNS